MCRHNLRYKFLYAESIEFLLLGSNYFWNRIKDLSLVSRKIQTQNCGPIQCTVWIRKAFHQQNRFFNLILHTKLDTPIKKTQNKKNVQEIIVGLINILHFQNKFSIRDLPGQESSTCDTQVRNYWEQLLRNYSHRVFIFIC